MTHEEYERLTQLCRLIQQEKDHAKFTQLCEELNDLLEQKERRFKDDQSRDPLLR
jgi:hypothetical protein